MRLVALLSFFDEPVELLALCVDGAALAGCSAVVAVDGRYATFPANDDVSPAEQRAVIDAACRHHGLGLTMVTLERPWVGEAEKRTQLFATALASSDQGDWWWNLDADTIVIKTPDDLLFRLAAADEDTATVLVHDTIAARIKRRDYPPNVPFRMLFRAAPIVVGGTTGKHYEYTRITDGAVLWRGIALGDVPALDLSELVTVEHRADAFRNPGRILQKDQYYGLRERDGLEMGDCARCDEPARHRVYVNLKMHNGIPVGAVAELCDRHAREYKRRADRWLRDHDFDPKTFRFNERYALPNAR